VTALSAMSGEQLIANIVLGAQLESVPEAGHWVYFRRPEIFNRVVSNFFEKLQGLATGSTS
jgi:pimeloyl-ACP methyl ester carboxylesterase